MNSVVSSFDSLDAILSSLEPQAALDHLIAGFRESGDYSLLFEATLMKRRHERGLPLIQTAEIDDPAYQQEVVQAARETGQLFLQAGNIERAWPYFRAIGETEPVREAIRKYEPISDPDPVAAIAFQEGVHPSKGLELILAGHGMCRALTAFGMTAVATEREDCIRLLAKHVYMEIDTRLRNAIEAREGSALGVASIVELMNGRDWLFGEWDYYVDTSHLLSVIPYCTECREPALLRLMAGLCAYGQRLAAQFHQAGVPPFEDQFTAYSHYTGALLAENVEIHLDYFREKAATADPGIAGDAPARTLAQLLIATGREAEALRVIVEQVNEGAPYGVPVPTALQLCYGLKKFDTLKTLARERGDLLSYAAAGILRATAV